MICLGILRNCFLSICFVGFVIGAAFTFAMADQHLSTNVKKQRAMEQKNTLETKFKNIKIGMSKQQVIEIMGEPQYSEKSKISFFEPGAPKVGQQPSIYVVKFRNDKVSGKSIVPGPCATGNAL